MPLRTPKRAVFFDLSSSPMTMRFTAITLSRWKMEEGKKDKKREGEI